MFYSCLTFGICHLILCASLPLHQSDCLGTSFQCRPIIFLWAFYQFKFLYLAEKVLSKCTLTNLNKWRRLVVSAIERIITTADARMKQNEAVPADSFWFFIIALLAPVEPCLQAAKSPFGTSHFCSPLKSKGTKITKRHCHTLYSVLLIGHLAGWTGTLMEELDKGRQLFAREELCLFFCASILFFSPTKLSLLW